MIVFKKNGLTRNQFAKKILLMKAGPSGSGTIHDALGKIADDSSVPAVDVDKTGLHHLHPATLRVNSRADLPVRSTALPEERRVGDSGQTLRVDPPTASHRNIDRPILPAGQPPVEYPHATVNSHGATGEGEDDPLRADAGYGHWADASRDVQRRHSLGFPIVPGDVSPVDSKGLVSPGIWTFDPATTSLKYGEVGIDAVPQRDRVLYDGLGDRSTTFAGHITGDGRTLATKPDPDNKRMLMMTGLERGFRSIYGWVSGIPFAHGIINRFTHAERKPSNFSPGRPLINADEARRIKESGEAARAVAPTTFGAAFSHIIKETAKKLSRQQQNQLDDVQGNPIFGMRMFGLERANVDSTINHIYGTSGLKKTSKSATAYFDGTPNPFREFYGDIVKHLSLAADYDHNHPSIKKALSQIHRIVWNHVRKPDSVLPVDEQGNPVEIHMGNPSSGGRILDGANLSTGPVHPDPSFLMNDDDPFAHAQREAEIKENHENETSLDAHGHKIFIRGGNRSAVRTFNAGPGQTVSFRLMPVKDPLAPKDSTVPHKPEDYDPDELLDDQGNKSGNSRKDGTLTTHVFFGKDHMGIALEHTITDAQGVSSPVIIGVHKVAYPEISPQEIGGGVSDADYIDALQKSNTAKTADDQKIIAQWEKHNGDASKFLLISRNPSLFGKDETDFIANYQKENGNPKQQKTLQELMQEEYNKSGGISAQDKWQFRYNFALMYSQKMMAEHVSAESLKIALALHAGETHATITQDRGFNPKSIGQSPPPLAKGAVYNARQIGLPLNASPLASIRVEGQNRGFGVLKDLGRPQFPDIPLSPPADESRITYKMSNLQPSDSINPTGISSLPLDVKATQSIIGKSATALPPDLAFAPLLADDRFEALKVMGITDIESKSSDQVVANKLVTYMQGLTDRAGSNNGIFIAHGKQGDSVITDAITKEERTVRDNPLKGIVATVEGSPTQLTEKIDGVDHLFVKVNIVFSPVEKIKKQNQIKQTYQLASREQGTFGVIIPPRSVEVKIPINNEDGKFFPDLSDLRKKTALAAATFYGNTTKDGNIPDPHVDGDIVLPQEHMNANVGITNTDNVSHTTALQRATGFKIVSNLGNFFRQDSSRFAGTINSTDTGMIVARKGNIIVIMTGHKPKGDEESANSRQAEDDRGIHAQNSRWPAIRQLVDDARRGTGLTFGDLSVKGGAIWGNVLNARPKPSGNEPGLGGLHQILTGQDRGILSTGSSHKTKSSGVRFIVVQASDDSKLAGYSEGSIVKNIDSAQTAPAELTEWSIKVKKYVKAMHEYLEKGSAEQEQSLAQAKTAFEGNVPPEIQSIINNIDSGPTTKKVVGEDGTTTEIVEDEATKKQRKIEMLKSFEKFIDGAEFHQEDKAMRDAADLQEKDSSGSGPAAKILGTKTLGSLGYHQAYRELGGILERLNQDEAVHRIRGTSGSSGNSTETLLDTLRSKTQQDPELNPFFPHEPPQRSSNSIPTYVIPDLYSPKETGGTLTSRDSGISVEDSIHNFMPDFIKKQLMAEKTGIVIHSGTRGQVESEMQIDTHPDIIAEKAAGRHDDSATTWTAPDGTIFLGTAKARNDKRDVYESLVDELSKKFNQQGIITQDPAYHSDVEARIASGKADPSLSGLSGQARYDEAYRLDFRDQVGSQEEAKATPFDLREKNEFTQEKEGADRIQNYDNPNLAMQITSPVVFPAARANILNPATNGGISVTNAQRAAIVADGRAVKVIAGVGSGKTTAIAMRIQDLIQARGVSAKKILAFSFTSASAEDLKDRVKDRLGETDSEIIDRNIGTFHAIVRGWIASPDQTGKYKIQIKGFNDDATNQRLGSPPSDRYITSDASKKILSQIIKSQNEIDGKYSEKDIIREVSDMREKSEIPDASTDKTIAKIYELFENRLTQDGLMDYASSMKKATEALENNPVLRAKFLADYTHVHVDEFQDVNRQQFRLITALTPKGGGNLFVVGDPHQAIYGFRGGKNEYIQNFDNYFSRNGVPPLEVKLNTNQRSTSRIVEAVNAVGKSIGDTGINGPFNEQYSNPANGSGSPIHIFTPTKRKGQEGAIRYIKNTIESLFASKEFKFSEADGKKVLDPSQQKACAIICRTNDDCELLTKQLSTAGIKTKSRQHIENLTEEEKKTEEMRFKQEPGIPIMTIHTAKGLEFDHVFMYGTDEGNMPKTGRENIDQYARDLSQGKSPSGIKDTQEGNLFYVGLSRAKKAVYMVGTNPNQARWISNIMDTLRGPEGLRRSIVQRSHN